MEVNDKGPDIAFERHEIKTSPYKSDTKSNMHAECFVIGGVTLAMFDVYEDFKEQQQQQTRSHNESNNNQQRCKLRK